MRLRIDQLTNHLTKHLLPVYLISGNEHLLLQEAASGIANAAKRQNFLEHRVFQVENHFDWEKFLHDAFTVSLFSAKGIIELRFTKELPSLAANKALQSYFEHIHKHKILIIIVDKLDANAQKTIWFKTIDQIGAILQVWPIERNQLPIWLSQRAKQRGLQFAEDALLTLAELVEGNLLAAIQALDRIELLCVENVTAHQVISCEDVLKAAGEQAQFTIFDLIEALLSADLKRAYRIFYLLKDEGVEPLFILNMLVKEIRLLASILYQTEQGQRLDNIIKSIYLPAKKQALLKRVVTRFSSQQCRDLIQQASKVDYIVKGVEPGDSWHALSELCLGFV